MNARIQLDPPVKFLIIVLAVAAALAFEVARAHGQSFATEVYPPSAAKPVRRSTIDTSIPRAADQVTPTTEPTPTSTEPAFADPIVAKPKLLFLTCRNAPSFMFSQLAGREVAALEKLREKYDIIQVNVPALPSIVDVDANRLYTPDQCQLYYGCAPIAGLVSAIEANKPNTTDGGSQAKAGPRVTRAHTPSVPQDAPDAVDGEMTAANGHSEATPPPSAILPADDPTPSLGEAGTLKPVPDPAFK